MGSLVEDMLYPASFGGASFSFIGEDQNAGRKTVTHEYPNAEGYRFVEDLGKNLRTFSIRGIVSGFFYKDNKKILEDRLNTPGIQILVHPYLGNLNCVCTGYTVNEEINRVGVANYTMNFEEAKPSVFPRPDNNNTSIIANLYNDIYEFIKNDLNGQYIALFANNVFFAGQKLQSLSDTLNLIATTTKSLNVSDTDFQEESKNFNNNAFKIAGKDGDIGGNISDLVSKFDGLSTNGQTRFDASSKFFGFGGDDEYINGLTIQVLQKINNQKLINGSINLLAFTNLIDSSKDIEYKNEQDLNETSDKLDDAYDYLLNEESLEFSNESLDKIDELRSQSKIFFEQERLVVNKIYNIGTKNTPMTILAFQYYGNTDNYNELLILNSKFNPSMIEGNIKILEA